MTQQANIRQLSAKIQRGDISAEALNRERFELGMKCENVFMSMDSNIIESARAVDAAIQSGKPVAKLSGIPVTLKDLYDVRGQVTLAGSIALKHSAEPAAKDSDVVAPLREAGLLFLGRTNMSEFAFSGMGINPHYGTPLSIWDRETGRLPGGSSSGSAVSVGENVVPATMGSDTAGSCRTPAAFNGIVGVKPSYGRISLNGVYPLSPTSDVPGPMAVDVDSCFILDALISGSWDGRGDIPGLNIKDCKHMNLIVPRCVVLDDLDSEVERDFQRAVEALQDSGAGIRHAEMPVIDRCVEMFVTRAVAGYEALRHHREMLEAYGEEYDPFVFDRIMKFKNVSDEEQRRRYEDKAKLKNEFEIYMKASNADAVIYPTAPCIPPAIASVRAAENMAEVNLRNLRNTAAVNYFDGCSITLPCHDAGQAPTGLMVSAAHMADRRLYQLSGAIERVLDEVRLA